MFRSPSSGLPSEEPLQDLLASATMKVERSNKKSGRNDPLPTMEDVTPPFGTSYRNMMAEVKQVFDGYETIFPAFEGKELELAGFFWFQGFNDKFGDFAPGEYGANMKRFINDVRKELDAPNLPFVIAAIGNSGSKPAEDGCWSARAGRITTTAARSGTPASATRRARQ